MVLKLQGPRGTQIKSSSKYKKRDSKTRMQIIFRKNSKIKNGEWLYPPLKLSTMMGRKISHVVCPRRLLYLETPPNGYKLLLLLQKWTKSLMIQRVGEFLKSKIRYKHRHRFIQRLKSLMCLCGPNLSTKRKICVKSIKESSENSCNRNK